MTGVHHRGLLYDTCASLLYHRGVRLASVHMIEESTITKLRNVVGLLSSPGAISSEFEALELSSATTSCSRALYFSNELVDVVFTEFAIDIFPANLLAREARSPAFAFGSSLS